MSADGPRRRRSPGFESIVTTLNKESLVAIHERIGEVSSPGLRYEPVLDFIGRQIADRRAELDAPRASALVLHGIITRHPFWDGNKRTAFVAAEAILFLGNMRFDVGMDERFDYCLDLARRTEDAEKDGADPPTVDEVEGWIRENSRGLGIVTRFVMWVIVIVVSPFYLLREFLRGKNGSRRSQ